MHRRERFRHRSADIARCWAKYGLLLLSTSMERLMSEVDENEPESLEVSNLNIQELGMCYLSAFHMLQFICLVDWDLRMSQKDQKYQT